MCKDYVKSVFKVYSKSRHKASLTAEQGECGTNTLLDRTFKVIGVE